MHIQAQGGLPSRREKRSLSTYCVQGCIYDCPPISPGNAHEASEVQRGPVANGEDLNPNLPVSKARCFPWIRKRLESWDLRLGQNKGHLGPPPIQYPKGPHNLPALLPAFV